MSETSYSSGPAARRLGISIPTLKRKCDAGEIPYFLTPGGHRRIPADAVEELLGNAPTPAARGPSSGLQREHRQGELGSAGQELRTEREAERLRVEPTEVEEKLMAQACSRELQRNIDSEAAPLASDRAQSPNRKHVSEPNVSFYEQFVLAQVEFRNSKLTFRLDTGGETSSLEPRFAETFADIVKQFGKKDSKKVNEIGSKRQFDSIALAELELRIGGFPTVLRPAHILFDGSVGGCHYGSLGMDLMKQSQRTTIDFESMTLTMR